LVLLAVDIVLGVGREPRVKPRAGDKNIRGATDNKGKGLVAPVERVTPTTNVGRVPWENADGGTERLRGYRRRLVIGGLRLYYTGEDIFGPVEVILVEDGVFRRGSVKPNRLLTLDQ
jgi:hypothetical protein